MNAKIEMGAARDRYLEFAQQQAARFWSKVERGPGCWLWAGCKDKDGYGKFSITLPRVNGKQQQKHVRAHRLAYDDLARDRSLAPSVRHWCRLMVERIEAALDRGRDG